MLTVLPLFIYLLLTSMLTTFLLPSSCCSGAQLDKAIVGGMTPLFMFKHNLSKYKCQEVGPMNVFSLINVVHPLCCYCAQVIYKKRIPFEREYVPPPVLNIIRLHGANI